MTIDSLSQIANMMEAGGTPRASLLKPDVRSGVSFTFDMAPLGAVDWPQYQLVWFYAIDVGSRKAFATAIAAYETGATLATPNATYRGTYSVTISGAVPELEYRTVWGLKSLAAIQELNDALNAAPTDPASLPLFSWLKLISQTTVIRAELMGRTAGSALLTGGI